MAALEAKPLKLLHSISRKFISARWNLGVGVKRKKGTAVRCEKRRETDGWYKAEEKVRRDKRMGPWKTEGRGTLGKWVLMGVKP